MANLKPKTHQDLIGMRFAARKAKRSATAAINKATKELNKAERLWSEADLAINRIERELVRRGKGYLVR